MKKKINNPGLPEQNPQNILKDLRKSEQRYRGLVNNLNAGIALHEIILDEKGTPVDFIFLDANPTYEKITTLKKKDIIGKRGTEVIPILEQKWIDLYGKVALSGKSVSIIDHSEFLDKYWDIKAYSPAKNQFAVVMTDITERVRAQSEIQRAREIAEKYLEMAGNIFLSLNPKAEILLINQKGLDILEYSKEELIGKNWFDTCIPPEIGAEIKQVFLKVLKGDLETVEHYENNVITKSGKIRTISWYNSFIKNEKNEIEYLLSSGIDITDKKQSEKTQKKLQDQMAQVQKMESVGRLAGGVAHDFNNMLSVILGHADLILEEIPTDLAIRFNLEEIRSAALRSAKLTQQLLGFARKQPAAPRIIDLNNTIVSLISMLKRLIGENINLIWTPAKDLASVRIDPGQVDQMLTNLVVNARDAIKGVGNIRISTRQILLDKYFAAEHTGCKPGHYIQFSVNDDGCGIKKENQDLIFEPFFTTKSKEKGTGLGLSTVYGIVKQNNGYINVYSELNKGTNFQIYLPAQVSAENSHPAESSEQRSTRGGNETILLVEDEPATLEMGQKMLEKLGYRVLTASKPSVALKLAKNFIDTIHLLITDIVMPEKNGSELSKDILYYHPGTKCLFMSGYTADVIGNHGLLDEEINFIQKPFSILDLSEKIRKVLDQG